MLAILFYLLLLIILVNIIKIFGFLPGLVFIIFLYVISFILSLFIIKRNSRFVQFFGVPGSGKTTIASSLVKKAKKDKKKAFANFNVVGATRINKSDIGFIDLSDSYLIIDESGLDYNNRSWKSNFTPESLEFFKKHRHYNCDIFMFSQSYSDSDSKLRDLTTEIYILKRSIFPFFIRTKKIGKRIGIDSNTHQIIDIYKFLLFSGYYYFMPKYWKLFNTHEK